METKFKVGDVIIRSAYKESSKLMRDEQKVIAFISDEHPICPRFWYITLNCKGEFAKGLQSVIEEAFEKLS